MHLSRVVLVVSFVVCSVLFTVADDGVPVTQDAEAQKAALQKLNRLIGGWRGVGQVRRGSARGAWQETGEFVWDFQQKSPAIRYVVADGKLMSEGRITWENAPGTYRMELTTPEKSSRTYRGEWEKERLVFVSTPDDQAEQYRLTITPLNEKRTLVLHEKRSGPTADFDRVAEVGYTREGTRLASSGSGQPECIVTGGLGTTTVRYKGKSYYVCCSGCKQAFEENPEAILAEAAERIEKRRQEVDQ